MRDALSKIKELGAEVLGISPDSVTAQENFSNKLGVNFPLLSDTDHSVAEAYGVWGEKNLYGNKSMGITRSSFLIGEQGQILDAWYKVSPDDTVPKALKLLTA